MRQSFKMLTFVLILGYTTACFENKPDHEFIQGLTLTVNGESFEMIFVEGGTFTMGCTKEQSGDCEDNWKPAHKETLSSFYIGKYEVTQRLWKAIMESNLNQSYFSGCDDCAAEQVSWNDARKFIDRLNTLTDSAFRLPSEAEWEYAVRGGKQSKRYKYSGGKNIDEVAWYIDNYQDSKYGERGTKHPVGLKKAQ